MSKAAELAALIGSQTALSNRNLIINGAMQVAQRGTSSTSNGIQTVDRFGLYNGSLGVFTHSQSTDSPDGFAYSWKLDCTTADASPAASDYLFIRTLLEGQDLQQLSYGNSSAKACTVSFYAKANKTGSFTFSARQLDNSNRMYSKNVSISTANTWERISVELPADASGLVNNDNGAGLELQIWLNSGSTYSGGSEQAWGTETSANKYLGTLDLGASISDEFYITGIQLEVGEQATPFEHRSFGDELARCQRYYQQYKSAMAGTGNSSTVLPVSFTGLVPMRASATISSTGALQVTSYAIHSITQSSASVTFADTARDPQNASAYIYLNNFTGLQTSTPYHLYNTTNYVTFDAEL